MRIIHFDEINSTNDYAKTHIDELENGAVIMAEKQTAGYGRFKREWVDTGANNIYMTIILKDGKILPSLTQYLAVCICKTIESLGLSPLIKWPNDVLINNKKVSGILAESIIKNGNLKGLIIGTGINLNSTEEILKKINQPATAINLELEQSVDKLTFTNILLNKFFNDYKLFSTKGFPFIKKDYERYSKLKKNEEITISIFNKTETGIF